MRIIYSELNPCQHKFFVCQFVPMYASDLTCFNSVRNVCGRAKA